MTAAPHRRTTFILSTARADGSPTLMRLEHTRPRVRLEETVDVLLTVSVDEQQSNTDRYSCFGKDTQNCTCMCIALRLDLADILFDPGAILDRHALTVALRDRRLQFFRILKSFHGDMLAAHRFAQQD